MARINLTCEQCGGNVELDDTREFGYCVFCKAKVLIKSDNIINEVTQNITKHVYGHQGKDVEELLIDGGELLRLGDDKKANAKYKKATEIEPSNWAAWLGYASTGGDRNMHISCVPAYKSAYKSAVDEEQEIMTFRSMVEHLPDSDLGESFIDAYCVASPNSKHEIFDLVVGVIGCDKTEIARLAIGLCPEDWRAWLAMAKSRQLRVRWVELEGFLTKKLPKDASDVLSAFLKAYQLAKSTSEEAKRKVLAYISSMERDNSYQVFMRELNAQIKREG